jgi:hypothetical protein
MSYDPQFISPVHLDWATQNKCVITDGECGFGRPCVGLSSGDKWVDWRGDEGPPNYFPLPDPYDGWVPMDAYHKHDCVAVLIHDDNKAAAWTQLRLWLDAIIDGNWVVAHETRSPKDTIDLLFHGTTSVRLVKSLFPKEIPVNSS